MKYYLKIKLCFVLVFHIIMMRKTFPFIDNYSEKVVGLSDHLKNAKTYTYLDTPRLGFLAQ